MTKANVQSEPISEETILLCHWAAGRIKNPRQQPDTLTQEAFRSKTVFEFQHLSRREGRRWSNYSDIPIGVTKNQFFICHHRNEVLTQERQREELEKTERILCIGCPRTQGGKTPLCVGHMLRLAWHTRISRDTTATHGGTNRIPQRTLLRREDSSPAFFFSAFVKD